MVGECLSNDRTFVGRTALFAWLASLWRQPEGKPTVVLIGQRRIGKTSLLHKIERAGLANTQLVPIFINIQDISSESDFLTTTCNMMAVAIGMDIPTLDKAEPYVDFKRFLAQAKQPLQGRRFLLMLDEADLIPDRKLGDLLPGFLRSLMQQHNYPAVLLFCGTFALKRAAWDYSSILFNTAQFKTISYLSAPESAELLQKPVRDILEFDDYVLEQAHQLTKGQPLLLQSLGANLIDEFNNLVWAGEERNNYVNFKDLEHAAQILVQQQDNAAFLEHWIHSDVKTHRVLSALAWATDELNRPQLDIDGLLSALRENALDLPRKPVFDIVQRLVDEQILESTGP
ncbi:MAG TPA: ATP-binding protein, partial [Thioploca sp.]|nr:ATP-binding protein [Thioploca sp.]